MKNRMLRGCRAHIQGACRSLNAALARWRRARYNIPCIRAQGALFGAFCARLPCRKSALPAACWPPRAQEGVPDERKAVACGLCPDAARAGGLPVFGVCLRCADAPCGLFAAVGRGHEHFRVRGQHAVCGCACFDGRVRPGGRPFAQHHGKCAAHVLRRLHAGQIPQGRKMGPVPYFLADGRDLQRERGGKGAAGRG